MVSARVARDSFSTGFNFQGRESFRFNSQVLIIDARTITGSNLSSRGSDLRKASRKETATNGTKKTTPVWACRFPSTSSIKRTARKKVILFLRIPYFIEKPAKCKVLKIHRHIAGVSPHQRRGYGGKPGLTVQLYK